MPSGFIDAYTSLDIDAYRDHKTVCFSFQEHTETNIVPILSNRYGWEAVPEQVKNRAINPGLRSSRYSAAIRSGLIVTDSPTEVYGLIDFNVIQRWFKIGQIQESCQAIGVTISNWEEFFCQDFEVRARALAGPIMMKSQKERRSEEDLLGYKRYSWDAFATEFRIFHDDYNEILLAFPKEPVESYLAFSTRVVSREMTQNSIPVCGLNFDETSDKIWLAQYTGKHNLESFNDSALNTFFGLDESSKLTNTLFSTFKESSYFVPARMSIDASQIANPMANLNYTYYFKEATFTLEDLRELGRKHGVKGLSDKTKAEICIILAEALGKNATTLDKPSLVFTGRDQRRPWDIQASNTWMSEQRHAHKPEDYFAFVMRVVANSAYAPNIPPLAAARVPTDGSFSSYFAIEPLNIFE